MRLSTQVQERFEAEHRILKKMLDLIPLNVEQKSVSAQKIAEAIDETRTGVDSAIRNYEKAGIITRVKRWRTSADGPGARGIETRMTIVLDYNRAKEALDKRHQAELMEPRASRGSTKPRATASPPVEKQSVTQVTVRKVNGADETIPMKVAVSTEPPKDRSAEILRAVAGPDREDGWQKALASLRKDEHYALVEAARQYAGRRDELRSKVKELEAAGVTLKVTIEEAFDFERDERLETIALVLPYIDQLERYSIRWAQRVSSINDEVRTLRAENEGKDRELRRLRPTVTPTVVHAER